MTERIHIIGGGLAGMTVAWEAAKHVDDPTSIVLYEKLDRLGGKAGSNPARFPNRDADGLSDHGYHLFPAWYRNVIRLMGEVGIDYDNEIIAGERFGSALRPAMLMGPETEPKDPMLTAGRRAPPTDAHPLYVQRGRRSGVAWVILTVSHLMNLRDGRLESLSMAEFLARHHPYTGRAAMPVFESLFLKAFTTRPEDMSALTIAKFFRYWATPLDALWKQPSYSSLPGSLETNFIGPLEAAIRGRGVKIVRPDTLLEVVYDSSECTRLVFERAGTIDVSDDRVVLAVPPDAITATVSGNDRMRSAAADLADMTAQFAGVDLYLRESTTLPRLHFGFESSAITAYNIAPIWPPDELVEPKPTVVQLVVPEAHRLGDDSGPPDDEHLLQSIRSAIGEVLPMDDADCIVNLNTDTRLSLATVQSHIATARLQDASGSNVWVAGDYMPSGIAVPSMEAAVGSGLRVTADMFPTHQYPGSSERPTDRDGGTHVVARLVGVVAAAIGWVERVTAAIHRPASRGGSTPR
jgi:protoporphyrinogen oxidase